MLRRRPDPYAGLQKAIGYKFRKRELVRQALMHRSHRFENVDVDADNQRLEFLGDAVLGLLAAASVYALFDTASEGELTCIRSRITSGKALAGIAAGLGIGPLILLGKGEENSGGRTRESNLMDALEALIGAAYLDGGMKAVGRIFTKVFLPEIKKCGTGLWDGNPKGNLQEICQRRWGRSPVYRIALLSGPSHDRVFSVEALVNGQAMGFGEGKSKREAEAAAAKDALQKMGGSVSMPPQDLVEDL